MNEDPYKIRLIPFYLWWTACAVLVWPLSVIALGVVLMPIGIVFNIVRPLPYDSTMLDTLMMFGLMLLGGLIIAAMVGGLQRWLLRTKLYWTADGWRFWTVLGGAFGATIVGLGRLFLDEFASYYAADYWMTLLAMPVFMLCVSLAQWVALRQAVRDAWFWVLGNVVAGMVFGGMLSNNAEGRDAAFLFFVGGVLAQAIITGFVLSYLFEKKLLPMQPDDVENKSADTPRPQSVWDEAI